MTSTDRVTKLERAAEKARREKAKLEEIERLAKESRAAQRKTILQAEAAVREETRKATNKRRYYVGFLAEEAGLFTWSNADLQKIFLAVARLGETPSPGAVLESLLLDVPAGSVGITSEGMATP
jgi:Cys-tRNA synthase (O-phospho-L-seryl-tRNA:Cys-tRNA synthase)